MSDRSLIRLTAFAFLLGCAWPAAGTAAQPAREGRWQLVRLTVTDRSQLAVLRDLDRAGDGFEIWSERIGLGPIDLRVSAAHLGKLNESGLRFDVVVDDLEQRHEELFSGAGDGFFDAYRTYEEHLVFMQNLVAAYPELAEMVNLGSSVQGRDLWAMRITGPPGDKPAVFFHGAQHGNEITNPAVIAFAAQYLLSEYGAAQTVTTLVDSVEWFLLPISNPDGYVSNTRYNAHGVDLNRNWGGPGSTADFSEPETAALRDFFTAHPNVLAHIDFHTYGYQILWPWGHTDELCVDHLTFRRLSDELAEKIFDVRGTDYSQRGPTYTTIYPVRGGSVDYVYGELGAWSWVYEVGGAYAVPVSEIVPTAWDLIAAMMHTAAWVHDCDVDGVTNGLEIAQGAADCNDNGAPDTCESDIDADLMIDACDPDIDEDGVPNSTDECLFGPVGSPATWRGAPISDSNGNCMVDLDDYSYYGGFPNCLEASGPGVYCPSHSCRSGMDYDDDNDVDLVDFSAFQNVFGD